MVVDILEAVDLREVRVEGLLGERLDVTWKKNLLALDVDGDFLRPFQVQDKKEEGGYIGLGKLMDALVHFAYYTGDKPLLSLKKHVFNELIKGQLPDGYIGTHSPENRISRLWDLHEISYLIFGLVSDYRYFSEPGSLEAARKAANYLMASLPGKRSQLLHFAKLSPEHSALGLERAFLTLHNITGDRRYLDFCIEDRDLLNWDREIVLGRQGKILGHAYVFLNRCIAQLELYHIRRDEKLLSQTRKVIDFLRKKGGLVITGSCSMIECWHRDQSGEGDLEETCATAYLIRLLDILLRLEGKAFYGDMMERAIYNALFAAQSPDGRCIRYYTPFEGKRKYWDTDTWCCPNNFRRAMAELPGMIYYKSSGGLVVNLYTASRLTTEITPGLWLEVHQETGYPNSGNVFIHLYPSETAKFPVRLRIPAWCQKFTVRVNNKPLSAPGEGNFLVIERKWKAGDTITLEMEMDWRLVRGFNRQQGRVAVMRGPSLFCLSPSRNNIPAGGDLKAITIDPSTLQPPLADDTLRSQGIVCPVKAYSQGTGAGNIPDMDLMLTEFPDPEGEATYFLTSDMTMAIEDELL